MPRLRNSTSVATSTLIRHVFPYLSGPIDEIINSGESVFGLAGLQVDLEGRVGLPFDGASGFRCGRHLRLLLVLGRRVEGGSGQRRGQRGNGQSQALSRDEGRTGRRGGRQLALQEDGTGWDEADVVSFTEGIVEAPRFSPYQYGR